MSRWAMFALQKSVYDADIKLTVADTVIEVGSIKKPRHLSEMLLFFLPDLPVVLISAPASLLSFRRLSLWLF